MDIWNYQVVEAGRFNEEWQRYTNSNKNLFLAARLALLIL